MGENLKLFWAEFSTISLAVLMMCMDLSIVENSAQVQSCQLKFVHALGYFVPPSVAAECFFYQIDTRMQESVEAWFAGG